MKDDAISRRSVIEAVRVMQTYKLSEGDGMLLVNQAEVMTELMMLTSAEPDIIQCKDCKHNPNITWFECPMSHLSESQRPETAWCWKAERRTDG